MEVGVVDENVEGGSGFGDGTTDRHTVEETAHTRNPTTKHALWL